MMKLQLAAATAALCMAVPAVAADLVQAELLDTDGNMVGTAEVHTTASGEALVTFTLEGLSAGSYAAHLHETGDCSADDFSSAGGHIAGDADHGIGSENGPHPGDLPNISVAEGANMYEFFNPHISIDEHLLDDDGAAFVVHAGTDDYSSQPSGDAGDRIVCGEFMQAQN